MQSNTNAIKQASNLYAFVMNNPIRWLDPWGLFAWNEADSHWFALRHEVEMAGGSVSWNANTYTATASIFGVNVDFTRGSDGVRIRNNRMYVRADTFYSTVVGAAEEMLFLGGHGALFRRNTHAYHAMLVMFVSPNSSYHGTSIFRYNVRWGNVHYATIGGYARNMGLGRLRGGINRPADIDLNNKRLMHHIRSEVGILDMVFASYLHFVRYNNDRVPYAFLPSTLRYEFNSNSFVSGLLLSMDFTIPNIRHGANLPGWERPVPIRYFRRF